MEWIQKIKEFFHIIPPSKSLKKFHNYGVFDQTSECHILDHSGKGVLLIAPFCDKNYRHTILIIKPRTLEIIAKISASKIWKLWDRFYVVSAEDLPTIKTLSIYAYTSKSMKKMKNVTLTSNFSSSLVQHVLGAKKFKTLYVLEDFRLCMISLFSKERQEWTSKHKILQGSICTETSLLILCSTSKIMVHSLDKKGKVQEMLYEIPFDYEFGTLCFENQMLNLLTFENRTKERGGSESDDEENDSCLYLSKLHFEKSGYEIIQDGSLLAEIPQSYYKFDFVVGNKVLVCLSDQEPLLLMAINTGEVLFKYSKAGNVIKVLPEEGALFISTERALQRISIDNYLPS